MMNKEICDYLDELIPNPKCELNYNKDYELLIATMLSAQTTDKKVNEATKILFKKYQTIDELAKADIDDIKKIIMPIGTYNKKAKNVIEIAKKLCNDYQGKVPNNRKYLESLPGVGRKTTNVVLSNLFNVPCIAVDTHVKRVSERFGISNHDDDVYTVEKKLNKCIPKEKLSKLHHQLVLFGRYHCKAIKPDCSNCKIRKYCKKKS